MKEEIVGQVSELKGRRTTMEIVNVKFGDREYKREIVHRPQAAVAIIKTEIHDRFLFVKQFRTAAQVELIEGVAGVIDPGETPEQCIVREIEEETGHDTIEWHKICSFYASPGYSDEIIHAFYVVVSEDVGEKRLDDTERVENLYYSRYQVEWMIANGEIMDGKTILAYNTFITSKLD